MPLLPLPQTVQWTPPPCQWGEEEVIKTENHFILFQKNENQHLHTNPELSETVFAPGTSSGSAF